MHLGTSRTAYFNWLAARASGGKFLLRIDDTNTAKSRDEYVDIIYQAMDYLKLDFDHSFRQSDRLARYHQVTDDLIARGKAYRADGAVFLSHELTVASFTDRALGTVYATQFDHDFIRTFVLLKSDGMPTYHFANVVDDIDYDINYVIRGNDHTNNTMKQIALYQALGAPIPQYAHIGLLCDMTTGRKMSKSDGAKSLLDYRDGGIDPDAMCNFLLRLGWGPKVDDRTTAVLPRDRALALFLNGGRLRSAPSRVDFAALASFDRKYKALKKIAA